MPVLFNGFPRTIEKRSLRPGRWFLAGGTGNPALCLLTNIGSGPDAVVASFSLGRIDALEFKSRSLASIPAPVQTVEDDLIFSPGDAEAPRLWAGGSRPFASGSLLRLSNGEMGVGFAETLKGELRLVSLVSGEVATGFDLVFDRWSLSIRRAGQEALVGRFRAEPRLAVGEARRS